MIEYGNGPNVTTRMFERVIANGTAYQSMTDDRERKLKEYLAQPQRGSVIHKKLDENAGEATTSNTKIQASSNTQKPSLKGVG